MTNNQKTKIYCDKCLKEIKVSGNVEDREPINLLTPSWLNVGCFALCRDCRDKFEKWMLTSR